MTYLRYLCLLSSSLPPVVLRRVHDLFTLLGSCCQCMCYIYCGKMCYAISTCLYRYFMSIVVLPVYVSCPQTLPLNNDVRVIISENAFIIYRYQT
jgi:hypothetical protein